MTAKLMPSQSYVLGDLLNLARKKLRAVPDDVPGCTGVGQLYLGSNKITALPLTLGVFSELHAFSMDDNPLTELPESLVESWPKLSHLNLSRTQITRLPEALARRPLRRVELHELPGLDWDQAFSVLAGSAETLYSLGLNGNAFRAVPAGLFALRNLKQLYLYGNALTELPERGFEALHQLEVFSVGNNKLAAVPEALYHHPTLGSFCLKGNPCFAAEKRRARKLGARMVIH